MSKETIFEQVNSNFNRLSITNFNIDKDEMLFARIIDAIYHQGDAVYFFGVRENTYWNSLNEILKIREQINQDFSEIGDYKILYKKGVIPFFSFGKIKSYEKRLFYLFIEFWKYFEIVFILKVKEEKFIEPLSKSINFEFRVYENLLSLGMIELSICKSENDILCIDSHSIESIHRVANV